MAGMAVAVAVVVADGATRVTAEIGVVAMVKAWAKTTLLTVVDGLEAVSAECGAMVLADSAVPVAVAVTMAMAKQRCDY